MTYLEQLHVAHRERVIRMSRRAPNALPPRLKPPTRTIVLGEKPKHEAPPPPPKQTLEVPPVLQLNRVTAAMIVRAVAIHFRLRVDEVIGRSRVHKVIIPRHIGFYVAAAKVKEFLPHIGFHMGGFDHTTVINGRDSIARKIEADPWIAANVEAVCRIAGVNEDAL